MFAKILRFLTFDETEIVQSGRRLTHFVSLCPCNDYWPSPVSSSQDLSLKTS